MALMKLIDESENGICGKCKYHECETRQNALWGFKQTSWFCVNERSINHGYRTVYTDSCEDFEERSE